MQYPKTDIINLSIRQEDIRELSSSSIEEYFARFGKDGDIVVVLTPNNLGEDPKVDVVYKLTSRRTHA